MKRNKVLAVALALAMTVSMAACGSAGGNATVTATPTPGGEAVKVTATPTPGEVQVTATPTPVPTVEVKPSYTKPDAASIDFEDGNTGFLKMYVKQANASDATLEIATLDGSKALKVTRENTSKVPFVAIDVNSLLGANAAKVAKVQMTLSTDHADGKFYSTSGDITAWYMVEGARVEDSLKNGWSIYMENKAIRTFTYEVPEGAAFGDDGMLMVTLANDTDPNASAALYIDDICFYDADGKLLKADTTVAFVNPTGFENTGHDVNLCYVDNEVALDGFACSAGGWSQAGIELTDEQRALFVPGSIITISYKCSEPVWMVAIGENPLGGWLRGVDQSTFVATGYKSADGGTIQYTYEQLVAFWGEDFGQYLGTLQCEGKDAWEVYAVTVGTKSNYGAFSAQAELEGFACSAGAWSQAGIELTDEQRALIKPGAIIQIEYKADSPVWMVAIGENPLGGWLRGVDQSTFEVCGAVAPEGGVVQYTYEQLAAFWGEGFEQYLGTLQCEAKDAWEVYSVKIGTTIKPAYDNVNLDGFAVSAGGWSQAGIDLTDEQRALFVPGSVVTISFKPGVPVWMVAIGENPLGGWLRGVDQSSFEVCGAQDAENGIIQYTYEQLVAFWGEDFGQYLGILQCEAKDAWEVYSVKVGKTN